MWIYIFFQSKNHGSLLEKTKIALKSFNEKFISIKKKICQGVIVKIQINYILQIDKRTTSTFIHDQISAQVPPPPPPPKKSTN